MASGTPAFWDFILATGKVRLYNRLMTKYVLHGGNAQDIDSRNDEFFKEILKDAPANPRILLVHFAGKPERKDINWERDTKQFERVKGDRNLTFESADEQSFLDQILTADVIYFGGGTTQRLLDTIKKFAGLKELFNGKIVAGESAGANALSAFSYSKSGGGIFQGLGIIPVKTIPHYKGEHKEDLDAILGDLEILLLPEYKYRVFNI